MEKVTELTPPELRAFSRTWFGGKGLLMTDRRFCSTFGFDLFYHTCLWNQVQADFQAQQLTLRDYLATFVVMVSLPNSLEKWAPLLTAARSTCWRSLSAPYVKYQRI